MKNAESLSQSELDSDYTNVVQLPVQVHMQGGANTHENAPLDVQAPKLSTNAQIAEYFGVKVRTVQNWSATIRSVGFEITRNNDGSLTHWSIAEYQKIKDMGQQAYLNSYGASSSVEPSTTPMIEAELEAEQPSQGLTLYQGLTDLSLPTLVQGSNDTAYLQLQQKRLEEFQKRQEALLAQMRQQFEATQALNAQYQQAMSLADQLQLQEAQLKGAQLGFAYVATKQEAFKATIQAVEAGQIPVGKSQSQDSSSVAS